MATELLKYANRAKVAAALTASGYAVTRMTVNRWASGGEMPGVAVTMVLALFGHTPDTAKRPPPEWAGAMEQRLRLELERNRSLIEALAPEHIRQAADLVIEGTAEPEQPEPGARPVSNGSEDQGASAPPGRGRG